MKKLGCLIVLCYLLIGAGLVWSLPPITSSSIGTASDNNTIRSVATQLVIGGTLPSASVGDGNFTVDEYGNVTYRSAGSTRTDEPQYVKLYEATSKGNQSRMFRAPSDGYTADDNDTIFEIPPGNPTFGGGYMTMLFPSLGTGQTVSQGIWAYGLYVTSPFTGLLKTTGTQVVTAAVEGTDYVAPGATLRSMQVDGHATATLTSSQLYNSIIYNTGQHLANVVLTLPSAATGMAFTGVAGEGQSTAAYWRFSANAVNTMCLDGVCGKTYIQNVQPSAGDILRCASSLAASTGVVTSATLAVGTDPTQVKTAAFTYDLLGAYYTKAAVDGTVPGDDVIPEDKYGAIALDISDNGTIDVTEASANATGYTTSALALAGLPAVASGHLRIGTVTAMKSDGAFTFGTTSLSDAAVTEAYASTAVYTKGYVWVCESAVGTWETN